LKYKALLLDFYGTLVKEDDYLVERIISQVGTLSPLVDATPLVRQRWWQLMGSMCYESHADGFVTQRDIEVNSLGQVLAEFKVDLDPVALCADIFANWKAPITYPDVDLFLRRLSLPVCIVSNIDEADVRSAMHVNGWDFPLLVTSEGCRAYKPRPELFTAALQTLGMDASEVLHVGDSVSADVIGAQCFGIDVAWMNRHGRSASQSQPLPTLTVTGFGELAARLGIAITDV
jgi:2-haloalkanoic acid dehalogenase type II